MCGIAGIVTIDGGAPSHGRRVSAMQEALAHRGPDGRAVWASPAGHAHFAHTRLAIIDPTPAARQPMSVDGGRLTIVLNGEIYNFAELRRELELTGVVFQTRSDTEVVLRAYDAYGDACVDRLRGMFAFAIWDQAKRQCLLARDRLGIKPLYYALTHTGLVFASELRALMASGLVSPVVDPQAAYDYFRTGSVREPRTLVAAARSIEAGHVASWTNGRFVTRRYWQLSFDPTLTDAEAVPRTRAALLDSVAQHFAGDVPIGLFLSGGIDSTALLALAREAGRTGIQALTMALPGTRDDELALAARTARHFGVPHETCDIDAAGARSLFPDYLQVMDQPSIDGLNTLVVSRLAQACGLKSMLSGLGADELFGGYPSVRAVPAFAAWTGRAAVAGPLVPMAGRMLERMRDPRARRLGDMLRQPPGLRAAYEAYRGIFTRAEAAELVGVYLGATPAADARDELGTDDPTPQDAVTRLELTGYLRNQLLRDTEVMGMSCGVEIRVPYLDARVIDTVTRIGAAHRLRRGKALLCAAVPEVPDWVTSQPKRGFMFPIDAWLAGAWGDAFADVDARSPVPTVMWYRKWCLRAFEAWLGRPQASHAHDPHPVGVTASHA